MKTIMIFVAFVILIPGFGCKKNQNDTTRQIKTKHPIPFASGIEWHFSVCPRSITLGEKTTIELVLSNPTDTPISVDSDILGHFSVLIKETSQHMQLAPVASAKAPDKLIISSGKTISVNCSVFTKKQQLWHEGPSGPSRFGFLVPRKGKYHLQLLNRGNEFKTLLLEIR